MSYADIVWTLADEKPPLPAEDVPAARIASSISQGVPKQEAEQSRRKKTMEERDDARSDKGRSNDRESDRSGDRKRERDGDDHRYRCATASPGLIFISIFVRILSHPLREGSTTRLTHTNARNTCFEAQYIWMQTSTFQAQVSSFLNRNPLPSSVHQLRGKECQTAIRQSRLCGMTGYRAIPTGVMVVRKTQHD